MDTTMIGVIFNRINGVKALVAHAQKKMNIFYHINHVVVEA